MSAPNICDNCKHGDILPKEYPCNQCCENIPGKESLFELMGIATNKETDPTGKNPHESGAKLDHGKNRLGLVLNGFPNALEQVGIVGTYGAKKYSDDGWLTVENGIARYTDAMHRHLNAHAKGEEIDPQTGLNHLAQATWNSLAVLELTARQAHTPHKAQWPEFLVEEGKQ